MDTQDHDPDRPVVRPGVRDPGLQPERTAMSWTRTGLSLVVASLVTARAMSPRAAALALLLAAASTATGLALVVSTGRRDLHASADRRPDGRLLATTTAACVLLGLGAVTIAIATR